jgi:hypothetical protein
MTRSRHYAVTVRNGYSEETTIQAAPKKALIKKAMATSDRQVVSTKYLGWHDVSVVIDDEYHRVVFESHINGDIIQTAPKMLGYRHLQNLLPEDYENAAKTLNE